MKISIIGYGKMGRTIHEVAKEMGIDVSSIIDPTDPNATHSSITKEAMENVDVVIDFSSPKAVLSNVEKVASFKRNIVMGTTGWYENLNYVKEVVQKNDIGFIYSPNFSIGVNIFFNIVERAAELVNNYQWYDAYVYEAHHNQKLDSPSGTAKQLGQIILSKIQRKKKMLFGSIDRKIEPDELHITSVRAGYITGIHIVGFDSEFDNIELKHEAKNRKGFAIGALIAARWIKDKRGFYSF